MTAAAAVIIEEKSFKLKKFIAKWTGITYLRKKIKKWKSQRAVQDPDWTKSPPMAGSSVAESESLFFRTYNTGKSMSRIDSGIFCSIDDHNSHHSNLHSHDKGLDDAPSNFLFKVLGGLHNNSYYPPGEDELEVVASNDDSSDLISGALSPYIIQKVIGTGSFSKVKLAIDTRTGDKVAIKIISTQEVLSTLRLQKTLLREVEILRTIRHPNIVEFRETALLTRHTLGIVMSYIPGTELFHYVADRRRLTELETAQILKQVLYALKHIHELGIVHRDLKLENIIVATGPQGPKATLIDFGLARVRRRNSLLTTRCGSEEYAAPEVILGEPYDGRAADLWSMGVVLYACLVGSLPFNPDSRRPRSLAEKIIAVDYPPPDDLISPTAASIIRSLLVRDPKSRLKIEELLLLPWINQPSSVP